MQIYAVFKVFEYLINQLIKTLDELCCKIIRAPRIILFAFLTSR